MSRDIYRIIMKKIFSLSFILLLMAFNSMAQKNTVDTSAGKWNGVWDPTDPKCPCYNIQKQAEKEYQEMLKKEKKDEEQAKKNNISKDSSLLTDKKLIYESDNTSDVKIIKHKFSKKKKKGRERKYKKGKAVCPEI